MKRSPRWLRFLGRFGFAALLLGTCLVLGRWVALGRGHARAQEIANRHRAKPPLSVQAKHVPDADDQPAADAASPPGSPKGTPVRELPLVGMAFSDDPAAREEFGNLVAEVRRIVKILGEARDTDGFISFRKALEKLGIAVPEGMTEAEAAAEFLRQTEKMTGTLAQLRSALEMGPWDWGKWRGWDDVDHAVRRWGLIQMLQTAANATSGIIQAHWQTGDPGAAWQDWEMMRLLSARAGDDANRLATSVHSELQWMWRGTVGAGISLRGWTDDQLALIPQSLASYDSLGSMRRGLEAETEYAEDLSRRLGDVRTLMKGASEGLISRLTIGFTTDQQIKDNLAVFAADYDYSIARFDYEKRVYVPPKPSEQQPSFELGAELSPLTRYYFLPFMYLGGEMKEVSFIPDPASQAIVQQALTDQARLAAALEIQRRATGRHPDSLDAVGGSFPSGMPHDVATGQPYFYERTPDGAYKLWGIGIDQTNDSGDPKRDILFTSPKLQTH